MNEGPLKEGLVTQASHGLGLQLYSRQGTTITRYGGPTRLPPAILLMRSRTRTRIWASGWGSKASVLASHERERRPCGGHFR